MDENVGARASTSECENKWSVLRVIVMVRDVLNLFLWGPGGSLLCWYCGASLVLIDRIVRDYAMAWQSCLGHIVSESDNRVSWLASLENAVVFCLEYFGSTLCYRINQILICFLFFLIGSVLELVLLLRGGLPNDGAQSGVFLLVQRVLESLFLLLLITTILCSAARVHESFRLARLRIFRGMATPTWRVSMLLTAPDPSKAGTVPRTQGKPMVTTNSVISGGGDPQALQNHMDRLQDLFCVTLFGLPVTNRLVNSVVSSLLVGVLFTLLLPLLVR